MQVIAANLISNMTFISVLIIASMVIIFAIAVINNLLLKQSYARIIKELEAVNNDGMEVYNNKMLNEIVSTYKEAYLKSYDGVNTQAIIESKFYKLDKNKVNKESFLNNVNTLLITLGIVGTLYNIIVIVTKITQIFKGVDTQTIPSMTSVMGDVSTIIAYLAIAFVTTFIAIALCFIYSIINSFTHIDMERANLFSRLEDYLDNTLATNLSKQKPKQLASDSFSNANVLYALKNTSDSMMKVTSQLEATLTRLNGSIKETLEEKTMNISNGSKMIAEVNNMYSEDEDEFEGYEQLRLERIKKIQETKKELEAKTLEKLDSMKYADVIPNKDKVYVKEVVDEELTKQKNEEIKQKEEVKQTVSESVVEVPSSSDKTFNTDGLIKHYAEKNPLQESIVAITSKPVIPTYEFSQNDMSTNELHEEIKKEERKLNTILSEEENVVSSNTTKVTDNADNQIRALTNSDLEKLKQELLRKQEEDKKIQEIMNSYKK